MFRNVFWNVFRVRMSIAVRVCLCAGVCMYVYAGVCVIVFVYVCVCVTVCLPVGMPACIYASRSEVTITVSKTIVHNQPLPYDFTVTWRLS